MGYPSYDYTFAAYQSDAEATAKGNHETEKGALCNWAMGLAGEAGEVVDELKKVLFHDKPRDLEQLKKELGDVLWYVAACCMSLGISLEDVAKANIQKLRHRHGADGFKRHGDQRR